MAAEPRTIKIQLKHERTEGISERYPTTSVTYLITASEAQIMVERDLHLRRQEVADPEQAKRPSIHEICDELVNVTTTTRSSIFVTLPIGP